MKKSASIILTVMLVLALALSVSASNGTISKEVTYRDVKITLNGEAITPKDANGNPTEPFIMDGSTYLPVRAVADALGLSVDWDATTSTVKLSDSSFSPTAENTTKNDAENSSDKVEIVESGYFMKGKYLYAYAHLHNYNTVNAIQYPSFRITAKSSNGTILGTDERVLNIIYPGQDNFDVTQAFSVDETPATVEFEMLEPQSYKIKPVSSLKNPEYKPLTIENATIRNEKITGEIKNENDYSISRAKICVVFFNDKGEAINGDYTFVSDLSANKSTPFDISISSGLENTTYKVYADLWI